MKKMFPLQKIKYKTTAAERQIKDEKSSKGDPLFLIKISVLFSTEKPTVV
jgi:hypothetical protein